MDVKEMGTDVKISLGALVSVGIGMITITWVLSSIYHEFKLHTREIEFAKERIDYVDQRHDRINERIVELIESQNSEDEEVEE